MSPFRSWTLPMQKRARWYDAGGSSWGFAGRSEPSGDMDFASVQHRHRLVPTGVHPRRRVVGYVGIQVVALRPRSIRLHRIRREEAAQGGVQVASAEEREPCLGIKLLSGEAEEGRRGKLRLRQRGSLYRGDVKVQTGSRYCSLNFTLVWDFPIQQEADVGEAL